jgi:hypothetical protein
MRFMANIYRRRHSYRSNCNSSRQSNYRNLNGFIIQSICLSVLKEKIYYLRCTNWEAGSSWWCNKSPLLGNHPRTVRQSVIDSYKKSGQDLHEQHAVGYDACFCLVGSDQRVLASTTRCAGAQSLACRRSTRVPTVRIQELLWLRLGFRSRSCR